MTIAEMEAVLNANKDFIGGDVALINELKNKLTDNIDNIDNFHSILNTYVHTYYTSPRFLLLVKKFNKEYETMLNTMRLAQELERAELYKGLDSLVITPSVRDLTRAFEQSKIIRKRPSSKKKPRSK